MSPQMAAKGAKLEKLNSLKKAISNPVLTKVTGGKVSELPGNAISGITVYGKKKPTYTTKEVVMTKKVPNKSVDVGVPSANSHEEKYTVTKRVANKAEGGTVKKKLATKGGKKKCSCGCDMILSKAAGGKVIETCACKCGGKMKKKPVKAQDGIKVTKTAKVIGDSAAVNNKAKSLGLSTDNASKELDAKIAAKKALIKKK